MFAIFNLFQVQAEPSLSAHGTIGNPSSSSSVASRLYLSGYQQRNSRRNSFNSEISEPELMSFDPDVNITFNDASNQMSVMSKNLADLHDLYITTTEDKSRLKTENAVLQERVHLLEEQSQASEQRWSEKVEEEKQRLKDMFTRFEREKQLEAESGSLRYQVLERDFKTALKDKNQVETQLRESQSKVNSLRDKLSDLQTERERLEEEKKKLIFEFEKYRIDAADRMENNAEILEELTKQSDQLKSFPHQGSLTDQIIMLEDEVERLRLENREFREQNKDMQAQILHNSVECGRNLLAGGLPSLAAELSGMDSQGLMNTLREQELVNQRLRNYVNGILMRIIERHPDILEIKEDKYVNNGVPEKDYTSESFLTKLQPTTQSNSIISSFRRSAGERLSLRYWYGGSGTSSVENSDLPLTLIKSPNLENENAEDTAPTTFVKRFYNSFLVSDWKIFGSQKEVTDINFANAIDGCANKCDNVLKPKSKPETPPPDPCPLDQHLLQPAPTSCVDASNDDLKNFKIKQTI